MISNLVTKHYFLSPPPPTPQKGCGAGLVLILLLTCKWKSLTVGNLFFFLQFVRHILAFKIFFCNPEYFVHTELSYAWDPDLLYAWNFHTAADRCRFSELLWILECILYFCTEAAAYEIYRPYFSRPRKYRRLFSEPTYWPRRSRGQYGEGNNQAGIFEAEGIKARG